MGMKRLVALLLCGLLFVMPLVAFSDEKPLLGDADGNGFVNASDAYRILRLLVTDDACSMQLDFDLDGKVSASDAASILRYASGAHPFGLIGTLSSDDTFLYDGSSKSAVVTFSDSRVQVHVQYRDADRSAPGSYPYRVTLSVSGYRIPGEASGVLCIEKPQYDISSLVLEEEMLYADLKNEFDNTVPSPKLPALPSDLAASYSDPDLTGRSEEAFLLEIDLSDPSGIYQPIPKQYLPIRLRDLWSDWY